jgi:hypothetical protein
MLICNPSINHQQKNMGGLFSFFSASAQRDQVLGFVCPAVAFCRATLVNPGPFDAGFSVLN